MQRFWALANHAGELAPGVIYGATASMALLPLVAAAQAGTVPYAALAELLGGAGINLLSQELFEWKRRSDEDYLAQQLPEELGRKAVDIPGWREVLDALVQETQVLAALRAGLEKADVVSLLAPSRRIPACLAARWSSPT